MSQSSKIPKRTKKNDGTSDRRMVRAELLGQHSHTTVCRAQVHIYSRAGKYIARGRYRGTAYGETLGGDLPQAASRLRRLLTEIEEGTFVPPRAARKRPLRGGPVPRLDFRQLCDVYLAEVRRLPGKRTAGTYLSRLSPTLWFADARAARRR
ncbi:hypothetical protein [Paludisphaera mucosa]|uniref:Core-binding (CB) domain-containing protein n=1 Tax=Paludisphaera mucosa TaxID=3030827 RepID=A0ABT6FEA7_9BACT|nr:hypothetical protein [Paludisphaera mucosa]MDG3005867.1 hypothetical protein [Paludisphaera mucosa]